MHYTPENVQLVNGGVQLSFCVEKAMFQNVAKWRSFKEPSLKAAFSRLPSWLGSLDL